jgi:hypothetical protein
MGEQMWMDSWQNGQSLEPTKFTQKVTSTSKQNQGLPTAVNGITPDVVQAAPAVLAKTEHFQEAFTVTGSICHTCSTPGTCNLSHQLILAP